METNYNIPDYENIEQDIPDELIEKRLNRIGTTFIEYGGVSVPIVAKRGDYDNKTMDLWIGEYGSQMGREYVSFNKIYDDTENTLNDIREKIKEVHERFIDAIERRQAINNLIDTGAKYFDNYDVKKLLIEALPEWAGSQTNAMTGSDYLNFAGHKLRFSDHQRPYNSKWNFIHGENHIDAITGLMTKKNITEWIDELTEKKLSDSDKEKISEYFDKMRTPKKETIEYPKMKNGGQVSKNHSSLGTAKELSITPIIREHNMIAECGDCGDKFSYQNSKNYILWECPECKSIKRIY